MTERYSFENSSPAPVVSKTKLDNSRSRFAQKSLEKQNFETKAVEVQEKIQERKQRAFELSQEFLEILKSKTLVSNKGPIEQSVERDVIKKLTEFSIEMNTDPDELENIGSTGVNVLLLKSVLILRDSLNEANFKIDKLEQELKVKSADGK